MMIITQIRCPILILFLIMGQIIPQEIRSLMMSLMDGWQFQCADTTCLPFITVTKFDERDCQLECLAENYCQAATFHKLTFNCELFFNIPNPVGNMLVQPETITMIVISEIRTPRVFNVNLLTNGDAETGPCSSSMTITSPTGWNYNGPISQFYYNTSVALTPTTPGPSNQGNCFFYGEQVTSTSMWQRLHLTNYVDPTLIDAQTVNFNLSAWLGGYADQDDNAMVSLIFSNQTNQMIGNQISIGPVLALDRFNQTSLVFRQTNGVVPASARIMTVMVNMTRLAGVDNDAAVDNIALILY